MTDHREDLGAVRILLDAARDMAEKLPGTYTIVDTLDDLIGEVDRLKALVGP
jgi:hypothetical protein